MGVTSQARGQRVTSRRVRLRAGLCRLLRPLPLSFAVAASTAALALVALPTGASAGPRVPPPACPPDVSLQAVERAPGGLILLGTVASVDPEVGGVRLAVARWYHRGLVLGLAPGEHPPTVDVALGPSLAASGRVALARLPRVGSRFLVAGTWFAANPGVSVACGIFADVDLPVGAAWLARADSRYVAMPPTVAPAAPAVPLDAPWFALGLAVAAAFFVAAILGALPEAAEPAAAT